MRTWLLMLIAAIGLITSATAQTAGTGVDAGAAQQSPAPTAATSSANKSESLDGVTVTARRAELAKRVSEFVNQIAATENEEGLPRWNVPVCPLVIGLPREEGEFMVERVSEVARAAGARFGHVHCHPNLFIIVSADPKKLLGGMTKRTAQLVFAGVSPSVIEEFIATPRAARVWYRTAMETANGRPLGDTYPVARLPGPFEGAPVMQDNDPSTHIKFNVIYEFYVVTVVVDQTRLPAISVGQFADYIAMVSLADLKPRARLGDAPTILKLFDGAPQAAPTGMTEWDQAFLKSLYATEQKSKLQRSQVAQAMVREIVH
jgi:hypothetical protein